MERTRIKDEKTYPSLSHPGYVIFNLLHPQYLLLGLAPGAVPAIQKVLYECLLMMDGTFSINVFKTHTIVSYNLELGREKIKSNSNGKVNDGSRLKVGKPGAEKGGKRMT